MAPSTLLQLCAVGLALLHSVSGLVTPLRAPRALAARRAAPAVRMGKLDVEFKTLDGSECRIGIIKTRWNPEIVSSLQQGCKDTLLEMGCKDEFIFETEVPGAFELPLAARFLALSGTVDAIVCIGCLIKGDTQHFEYICDSVSTGLMSVGLQTSTPVVFGVLTVNNEQQAKDRAFGEDNHGISWAQTAVEMALLRKEALMGTKSPAGFGSTDDKDGKDGDKSGIAPGKGGFGF